MNAGVPVADKAEKPHQGPAGSVPLQSHSGEKFSGCVTELDGHG